MRIQVMLRAMLALAATGMSAQIATGIHLQDIRFKGDTRLDGVDLKKCASDLKSQVYVGTDWTDYFVGTVETKCLLDKGYFNSAVTASTQQLLDRNSTHQFAVTFDIDAGPRYRLGHITFKGNHAISDQSPARPVPAQGWQHSGPHGDCEGPRKSALCLRRTGITFNDEKKLAFLEIDMEEGKKFYVGSIGIVGADPQVLNDLLLTKGQVYNVRLVNLFLRKHLPGADVNDPRI